LSLFAEIVQQARAQSLPEVCAVIAAILYLVLAIRQNIACWFFAAISTALYVWLFIAARLYMEAALNVFYLGMAGYGFAVWYAGRAPDQRLPVVVWPIRVHAAAATALLALSMLNGYLLDRFTDAAFPYIDSMTSWFAIWATFLVARKVLENWWYWLAIDAVSVIIYWSRDLQLTSILFVVYIVMIPFGLVAWTRSMQDRQAA
tara:strand:+ start:1632 stop:2240 length:609 start_codon:yes stop_codon:yes gene_type:complete